MNNQSLVLERIATIPSLLSDFVRSEEPTALAQTFASYYQLDEEGLIALENGIVLFLIGLFDRANFSDFLSSECRIPAADAPLVVSALYQVLPVDIQIIISELSQKNLNLEAEIKATEAILNSVSPKHNVSTSENIYTSTQSAILNESATRGQWETR